MAFDLGNINIHTVSALSINQVIIAKGAIYSVDILISMSNSAGIFQVQEGLLEKLLHSRLKHLVNIAVTTRPEDVPTDTRIVHKLALEEGSLVSA